MIKDDYTFCRESIINIENYELAKADNFKGWKIHHKLETHDENGNLRDEAISALELKKKGLYYWRPASELIFLTNSEHTKLHNKNRKKYNWTEEQRKAQSKRLKGKTGRVWTEEQKKAQSERRKKFFENGGTPWNKGKTNVYTEESLEKMRTGTIKYWEAKKNEC